MANAVARLKKEQAWQAKVGGDHSDDANGPKVCAVIVIQVASIFSLVNGFGSRLLATESAHRHRHRHLHFTLVFVVCSVSGAT